MNEYTYEKYLEQWECWICEGDTGTYGKHFVTKLTPEQFAAKLSQLETLGKQIDELQLRDDYTWKSTYLCRRNHRRGRITALA